MAEYKMGANACQGEWCFIFYCVLVQRFMVCWKTVFVN
jgi:hypothetical protein